jgi:hypothetical protein
MKAKNSFYFLLFLIPPIIVTLGVKILNSRSTVTTSSPTTQLVKEEKTSVQTSAQTSSLLGADFTTTKPTVVQSNIKPRSVTEARKFPRGIKEVEMTEKLTEAIEKERQSDQPDIYERLDYRLRFFASLSDCLGDYKPKKGEMRISLLFSPDLDRMIAVGVGPDKSLNEVGTEAFNIRESSFESEDERHILACIIESHEGKELDIKNTSLSLDTLNQVGAFYFPTSIRFPLEENDVYWFIDHEGEHYSKMTISRETE